MEQIKSASNMVVLQIAFASGITTLSGAMHAGLEIASPAGQRIQTKR